MADDLVLQEKTPGRFGWLRRLPRWQKGLLIFLVFFLALFINAYFRPGGVAGKKSGDDLMEERARARGYANAYEMMKLGGAPWAPPKGEMGKAGAWGPARSAASQAADYPGVTEADSAPSYPSSAPVSPTSVAAVPVALETWGRQLILNATIGLEVTDVRAAFEAVQTVAAAQGAVVTSANLQAGDDKDKSYNRASLVLRMPQGRFQAVRQQLTNTAAELKGKILQDQVSSEDVTEQYVDLRARLRHYKSQETQLLAIMGQARKISDILVVRDQLSSIQQEIERLSGQLRFLENRVDLSTITVTICQKGKAPVAPPKPPKPTVMTAIKEAGQNISAAGVKSLQDLVAVFGMLLIALTYLAPFALIGLIIWLPLRAARRRTVPGPPA